MKKMVQSIKGNNYIVDLAAGLGGLVWQLDHIDCIQDINSDILKVAEFIAHQNENYNVSVRLLDSIKEPLPNEGKGVFLFDPPMGLQREKPQEWEQFEKSSRVGMAEAGSAIAGYNLLSIWDIIGKNYKNTSSYTEILFIINFLLRAADDAYFICLVPETFLTKNENEYNNLRAYIPSEKVTPSKSFHKSLPTQTIFLLLGLLQMVFSDKRHLFLFYLSDSSDFHSIYQTFSHQSSCPYTISKKSDQTNNNRHQ